MLDIGLDMIALVQLDMLNDACPLWTIDKQVFALTQGRTQYNMPPSTNDVLSAFYRTMANQTSSATITQSTASYQWTFTSAVQINTISMNWPSASFPITFQYSSDNVNWTTANSTGIVYTGLTGNVANDFDNTASYQYWRVIPATTLNGLPISPANTLPLTLSGQVYNTPQDVLMYRMNRDDYFNLTNKSFPGRPLQFWLDRQIIPRLDLWPVPDAGSALNFMVVQRQRMLADPGSLQNTLELPARWYMAFFYRVACELAYCTPEVDPEVTSQMETKSMQMWKKAWNEERDKSPVKFQTNIGVYTR